MRLSRALCLLLEVVFVLGDDEDPEPLPKSVKTSFGTFTGREERTYLAFEGIPYAQPPVGELRFEPPVAVPKAPEETFVLNETGSPCVQINPTDGQIEGSEDCLYLNIYKPKCVEDDVQCPKGLLPVVFHIHGGGFFYGRGDWFGEKILMVAQNVIYVNFNYRLGVFGFLSSGDEAVAGNMGFKDQALALTWVKDNIEAFGGDPDNIIVTGFSAGAASVHLFYLSPLTRKLFSAGISHSGTALSPWVFSKNASHSFETLLSLVGCTREEPNKNVQCLRSQSSETLLKAAAQFRKFTNFPLVNFALVVEPESEHAFLTQHPLAAMRSVEEVAKKPWVLSTVKDEGYMFARGFQDEAITYMNDYWTDVAPLMFDYYHVENEEERANVSERVKEHYIKSDKIDRSQLGALAEIFSDRFFRVGMAASLELMAPLMPTFFYDVEFQGEEGKGPFVTHMDDMQYIYSLPHRASVPFSEEEAKMSDVLLGLYASLAISGVPKLQGLEFPPTSFDPHGNLHLIQIRSPDDVRIISCPHNVFGEVAFWEETVRDQ